MILTISFGSSLVFDIVGSVTSRNALWTQCVYISAKAETRNTTLRMTVPYFTDASQGVVGATDGHHLERFTSNCSLAPARKYNARKRSRLVLSFAIAYLKNPDASQSSLKIDSPRILRSIVA